MNQDLRERLAAMSVEIDEAVAARHLVNIEQELRDPGPIRPARRRRRLKVATQLAAAMLLLLPSAAFASEGAVPGDLLYPVKLAAERVLLLFDPNVAAEHRIEELEIVLDRAEPASVISDRLADAEAATRDTDVPDDLEVRLDRARDRVRTGDAAGHGTTPPGDDRRDGGATTDQTEPPTSTPGEPPPSTSAPAPTTTGPTRDRDRPGTSTTQPDRDGQPSDTTTSHPPSGRDDPPRDGGG